MGYRSFSEVLEDAQEAGLLKLSTDARSGTYVVTEFEAQAQDGRKRTRRGGRGRRGRGRSATGAELPLGMPGGEFGEVAEPVQNGAVPDRPEPPPVTREPTPMPAHARSVREPEPPALELSSEAPPAEKPRRRRAPVGRTRRRTPRSTSKP